MVERIIVGPLHTNAYVVSVAKKECLLIDPGSDAEQIHRRLEVLNMKPQAILLTHGHLDHAGAAAHIKQAYDGIPIGIHEADVAFLGPDARKLHHDTFSALGSEAARRFDEWYEELPAADFMFGDGDAILESDLVVMHTPGHTPGSVCFYSEERKALFSGDTLFFKSVGTTEIPDGNSDQLLESIMTKLFELPPDTRLFPGHGPLSTLEREMHNNPDLRREGVL